MSKKRFEWRVLQGAGAEYEFDVRSVKLGKGYEQRQALSLRPVLQTWQLEIAGHKALIHTVKAFFIGTRGVESFEWRAPNGEILLVKVNKFREKHEGGRVWRLEFEFEEVQA